MNPPVTYTPSITSVLPSIIPTLNPLSDNIQSLPLAWETATAKALPNVKAGLKAFTNEISLLTNEFKEGTAIIKRAMEPASSLISSVQQRETSKNSDKVARAKQPEIYSSPDSNYVYPELEDPLRCDHLPTKNAYALVAELKERNQATVPEKTLQTLTDWIQSYDQNQQFEAPPAWVEELLIFCFEYQIFPSSLSETKNKPETEDETKEEVTAVKDMQLSYLQRFLNHIQPPWTELYSICNRKQYRGCILYLFEREGEFYQTTIDTIERLISEKSSAHQAFLAIKSSPNALGFTLRWLKRILTMTPKDAIPHCVNLYPSIQPENIEEHLRNTPLHNYYLEYFDKLMQKPNAKAKDDVSLVEKWFVANLEHSAPSVDKLFDDKHNPLPNFERSLVWGHDEVLKNILRNPNLYSYDQARIEKLCGEYGYFQGLLEIYLRKGEFDKAIDICLYTDDLLSLNSLVRSDIQIDWNYVLERYEAVLSRDESNSDRPRAISKTEIVSMMSTEIGPHRTVELLLNHHVFSNNLPLEIYKRLLSVGHLVKEQKDLVKTMLDTVDSYLWKKKTYEMGPQFRAFKEYEYQQNTTGITSNEINTFLKASSKEQQVDPSQQKYTINFDYTTPVPRFYEESAGHWGVVTSLKGTCPYCCLPLSENVGSNVTIFPCGHAFHEVCVPEKACISCFTMDSLVP
eukprot:TRINITY_DN1797_c0_g1_i1.p1 TRINITY_DN1797_c0_g1~~TRINITY_DN1797_c0_g1_i1.p1  ORF type:complete len:686 (-),score=140.70 TRINITY_DN1797_c0_g1_i1:21-2078(-)